MIQLAFDAERGTVRVADRYTISSDLTKSLVVQPPIGASRAPFGALPYQKFIVRNDTSRITFSFFGPRLALVDFETVTPDVVYTDAIDFDGEERKLEVFLRREKEKSDRMLEKELGSGGVRHPYVDTPTSALDSNLIFSYSWGEIASRYHQQYRQVLIRIGHKAVRARSERPLKHARQTFDLQRLHRLRTLLASRSDEED